jgi:hypothetical protein
LSWDVLLQKFDHRTPATFDLDAARNILRRTNGFSEIEPGVGEVEGDGYAEIYYGTEPSTDVMIAVRVASPAVFRRGCELGVVLRMVLFFPTEPSWGIAVLDASQADDLPGSSWEQFEDGFTRPAPLVCADREQLAAALKSSYDDWHAWAHGRD